MGGRYFLIFYMICGVGSGLFYTLLDPFGEIPVVGSAGCIYGVIVAYLFLFPNRYVFHRWIKFKFICPLLLLGALIGGTVSLYVGGIITGAIFMRYVFRFDAGRSPKPSD